MMEKERGREAFMCQETVQENVSKYTISCQNHPSHSLSPSLTTRPPKYNIVENHEEIADIGFDGFFQIRFQIFSL